MEDVVEPKPQVELVVQSAAASALAVGVVREAVDVDIEIESAVCGTNLEWRSCRGTFRRALSGRRCG